MRELGLSAGIFKTAFQAIGLKILKINYTTNLQATNLSYPLYLKDICNDTSETHIATTKP